MKLYKAEAWEKVGAKEGEGLYLHKELGDDDVLVAMLETEQEQKTYDDGDLYELEKIARTQDENIFYYVYDKTDFSLDEIDTGDFVLRNLKEVKEV